MDNVYTRINKLINGLKDSKNALDAIVFDDNVIDTDFKPLVESFNTLKRELDLQIEEAIKKISSEKSELEEIENSVKSNTHKERWY